MSVNPEYEERLTRSEVEAVIASFSAADWQRAKTVASAYCAGLSDRNRDDLLQETLVKLIDGSRVWPSNVHPLVVLKNVMHSVASNARKHNDASPVDENVIVDPLEPDDGDVTPIAHGILSATPEDIISGRQQMAALYGAFGGDEDLELLTMVWADGLRGDDVRIELEWDEKKYDAVRKRLERRLDRLDPDRRKK